MAPAIDAIYFPRSLRLNKSVMQNAKRKVNFTYRIRNGNMGVCIYIFFFRLFHLHCPSMHSSDIFISDKIFLNPLG